MSVVTLMETGEKDFFAGSDGAFYTPVRGVEARCRWCRLWGHQTDFYYRQILYTRQTALVCGRHVQREEDWLGSA